MQGARLRDHWFTEFTGQAVGLMPPLFYCCGSCPVLLLHGFVAKQTCLGFVVKKNLLSWVIIKLQGSPVCIYIYIYIYIYLQSPRINYLITYFVASFCPYYFCDWIISLKLHLYSLMWQVFLPFEGWTISPCMYILHFLYSGISWRVLRMVTQFGLWFRTNDGCVVILEWRAASGVRETRAAVVQMSRHKMRVA